MPEYKKNIQITKYILVFSLVCTLTSVLAVFSNPSIARESFFPCKTAIRGSFGLYANAASGGNFNMQSQSVGPNETFDFIDLSGGKFAIKSTVTGLYANAAGPDGTENFNMQSSTIGQRETLIFISLGGNDFAIKSYVGRYAFTEGANFYISGTSIGQQETLTLVPISGCLSPETTMLATCVGNACSDGSGSCRTNADCGGTISSARPFELSVQPKIPTEGLPGFGQLIEMIFTWSLNILGIVVFVMIFYAGFNWFTAAGNTARVNEAKAQITNAITGAIILLAAWIILYTINPDLVGGKFTLPGLGTSPTGGGGGGGGGSGGGTGVCRNAGGSANYAGALRGALDAVINANPGGIANQPNTEANGFTFLDYVSKELQSTGFNATTNVKNGNDNPNQGDLIAVWRSGDTAVERYDAIRDSGKANLPLENSTVTDYTGDIPLSCTQ